MKGEATRRSIQKQVLKIQELEGSVLLVITKIRRLK